MGLEGKNLNLIVSDVLHLIPVDQNANDQSGLAANIAEAANFATYFAASPATLSTPHLYVSSLATWSEESTLSQQWKDQFPCIPSFTHLKASNVPLMTQMTTLLVNSIAFSSDGTRIVSGSQDRCV